MKVYNTYQEAKIENPNSDIYYTCLGFSSERLVSPVVICELCSPADYCMTLESFLSGGNLLVVGDVVLSTHDSVRDICDERTAANFNRNDCEDSIRYILRAKALDAQKPSPMVEFEYDFQNSAPSYGDLIETKTGKKIYIGQCPFEGEFHIVADSNGVHRAHFSVIRKLVKKEQVPVVDVELDTTPQQVESLAGGEIDWKSGDRCVFNGKECIFVAKNPIAKAAIIVGASGLPAMSVTFDKLSKPETPQRREERERMDEIKKMVFDFLAADIDSTISGKVEKVCTALYDAGYRKEAK